MLLRCDVFLLDDQFTLDGRKSKVKKRFLVKKK